MSIYSSIYHNICTRGVNKKELWENKENGLHRHHIVPNHSGGLDTELNFTYLSVREHIIAHYLLWKINRNPNDLRSMNMLGAELSYEQRVIVGKWCKENCIGFWSPKYSENRKSWRTRGAKTQIEKGIGIHNPEKRREYSSIGGKASCKVNPTWIYWMSKEGRTQRAKMGAAELKGRRCMFKPGENTFKRVKKCDIQKHIEEGYIFGSPFKPNKCKRMISHNRKPCTFNGIVYESISEACKASGLNYSQLKKALSEF
jgi:hypothetical protein